MPANKPDRHSAAKDAIEAGTAILNKPFSMISFKENPKIATAPAESTYLKSVFD